MSFELQIEEDNAIHDILRYLTENEELQRAAHGIALQVMERGEDSLTDKQRYVYGRYIRDKYFSLECARCHIPMPTCEVAFALEEGDKLCSWCRKMVGNSD